MRCRALLWGVPCAQTITQFPMTASSTPSASRRARTVTSGSPSHCQQDRAGSLPTAASPSFRSPPHSSSAVRRSRPAPTATSGSPKDRANKIGRITPAGVITEFSDPARRQHARGITAGPGRQPLVHRESTTSKIGRITPAGRRHRVLAVPTLGAQPAGIAAGPGRQPLVHRAWRRTRSAGSPRPASSPSSRSPRSAATRSASRPGPDGNLWFTERGSNNIGRITTAGVVTEFPIPTANSYPSGIAAGPDGNLWFTEFKPTRSAGSPRPA